MVEFLDESHVSVSIFFSIWIRVIFRVQISAMGCQEGHGAMAVAGTPMHLYAQRFEDREAFDEEMAQHASLIPAAPAGMDGKTYWCLVE